MYVKTFEHASTIIEQATAIAQATDRNILIHFFGDWCHWCHYLEESLEACSVKPLIQKHFVVVTLVEEGEEGENPGAWEMRQKFGGASCGVPFMVALDKNGQKIADSKDDEAQRGNIGCPYTKNEIIAFGRMLEATAPNLPEGEREQILDYFRHAPWRRASIRG